MASVIQRSFAGGEIAPALYGRADQAKYGTGARQIVNGIVQRFGGVTNRSGTMLVAEAVGSTSAKATRLRRFVYNAGVTYLLEFGDFTLRIIQSGARLGPGSPAAWSNATNYAIGDLATYGGIVYYAKAASLNKQPDTNPTEWYPQPTGVYEIPTPYAHADLRALQFIQSADVMTIAHPSYAVQELKRYSATKWILAAAVFAPTIAAPTGVSATAGTAGAIVFNYVVTAVLPDTFAESLASSVATCNAATPTSAAPNLVAWSAVSGALEYNIYKESNGVYGYIGTARGLSFKDINYLPSTTETLPTPATVFASSGNYPSAIAYFQQRLCCANTLNAPEGILMSRSGIFHDFSTSSPLQDDDCIKFSMAGREVQEVRHLLDLGRLVVLTSGGEHVITGDADGVVRPTAINPQQQGYHGAASIPPVVIGNSALFVQARGTIIRDLRYDLQVDGYQGRDLTIFAQHLFDGHSIVTMAYAENPHSVVWVVRDDGVLLGLTYVREHEVWGWHQHNTDGIFLDVEVVPEGNEDAVYALVERTVNGQARRFVERFASRLVSDVAVDAHFMDCGGVYDGRNTGSTSLVLTTATTWAYTEPITLTASAALFSSGDIGNAYVLTIDGVDLSCRVTAYTDTTHVTVEPASDVPTSHQAIATTTWAKAVDQIAGLSHLEGKSVAVLADGEVVANGYDEPQIVVSGGSIAIDIPAAVVHVGLPYTFDLETLDWENPQSETLLDKQKLITGATLLVQDTRGGFVGADGNHLDEIKQRATEGYGETIAPATGQMELALSGTWSQRGRILVRQKDPLPITVLAVIPRGKIGG
jgi:hypothetical protein